MKIRHTITLFGLALLAACGGPPAPGDSGYPYNVEGPYSGTLSVDGEGFAIEADFFTEGGGIVSGVLRATQPMQISAVIEGTLVGDQLALEITYNNNPVSGCSGSMIGTATVSAGGGTISGPMTVTDCADVLSGNLRLTRGS
jgi:hypothetical protein